MAAVGPAVGVGASAAVGPAAGVGAAAAVGASVGEERVAEQGGRAAAVGEVHASAGHFGVRRTLYFARRCIGPAVTRAQARAAVERCDVCRAIDPAPVRWRHGTLDVPGNVARASRRCNTHSRPVLPERD